MRPDSSSDRDVHTTVRRRCGWRGECRNAFFGPGGSIAVTFQVSLASGPKLAKASPCKQSASPADRSDTNPRRKTRQSKIAQSNHNQASRNARFRSPRKELHQLINQHSRRIQYQSGTCHNKSLFRCKNPFRQQTLKLEHHSFEPFPAGNE